MLPEQIGLDTSHPYLRFNGHPPLGVNATWHEKCRQFPLEVQAFQWAPTLGGECYGSGFWRGSQLVYVFQWAPTLGGECYLLRTGASFTVTLPFQWAPTLGGECYLLGGLAALLCIAPGFNGHPPLGVNATRVLPCGAGSPGQVSKGTHLWG